jgi:hypothetical protein
VSAARAQVQASTGADEVWVPFEQTLGIRSVHNPSTSLRATDDEPTIWIYFGTYLSCESTRRSTTARGRS